MKIAPALATGCTVVLKPSELTPLSALKFAELVREAGFPPGVFNIVNGCGNTAGQALVDHLRVRKIAFTGSTHVGKHIMESAGRSNLKRVTLELGGKSPAIVFDDADFEQSVKWVAMGVLCVCIPLCYSYLSYGLTTRRCRKHSGQMCVANSRIFVQEGIYDKFVAALVAAMDGLEQSDGFSASAGQGPLVSQAQLDVRLSLSPYLPA